MLNLRRIIYVQTIIPTSFPRKWQKKDWPPGLTRATQQVPPVEQNLLILLRFRWGLCSRLSLYYPWCVLCTADWLFIVPFLSCIVSLFSNLFVNFGIFRSCYQYQIYYNPIWHILRNSDKWTFSFPNFKNLLYVTSLYVLVHSTNKLM